MALPIVAIAIAAIGLGTACLWWTAGRADTISIERQTRTTRQVLSDAIDDLSYEQEAVARDSGLGGKLSTGAYDASWLDEHLGKRLYQLFGSQAVFLLDAQDRPIYMSVLGERAPVSDFEPMREFLKPLIDGARGRTTGPGSIHSRRAGFGLAPNSKVRTSVDAVHESDAIRVLTSPAAVSAMLIARPGKSAAGKPFVLISMRFFDADYLKQISNRDLVEGMRFSTESDGAPGEHLLRFVNNYGEFVGNFYWKPELPGEAIIRVMAPIGIVVICVFTVALAMLAGAVWRSGMKAASAMIQLQAKEAQAQHIAFHDGLTGLPNRALLEDRLDRALAQTRRGGGCAILALDLDRFKNVNDTLGHGAGDNLIREVARRVSAILGEIDTVARVGGDEFIVVLEQPIADDDESVEQICARIQHALSQPIELAEGRGFIGVSIGVAMSPRDGHDPTELLRKADMAMYRAKSDGRNCTRRFNPAMDETIKFRAEIEDDLRIALDSGDQLKVFYQPEIDPARGHIVGMEALIRWQHPTRGMISPEKFIPIAEEAGLIDEIGEWVMTQSCRIARRWPELFIALNLSPRQIQREGFVQQMLQIARNGGCRPEQFEFEVTEGLLIRDSDVAGERLRELRAVGFKVALDDFGTGYSSFSYLKKFHVDKIKIDRSFTQNICRSHESAAIVTSIVTLGHAMGMKVTAEGVETLGQRNFLRDAGCNELQGFLFSRAVPESEVGDLLAKLEAGSRAA